MDQHSKLINLPKIGIIGLSRSGKSFASEVLKKRFKFVSFTVSDVIREYAKENGLELKSRNDFWETANKLDKKFGTDFLLIQSLKKLEQQIKKDPNICGVILEGIRRYDVALGLKNMPNSLLISLVAPYQTRFERQRDFRPEDANTLDKFIRVEEPEETVFEKTKLLANVTIVNNQTKLEFEKQIIQTVSNYFPLVSK